MNEIWIGITLAYLMSGISYVLTDLAAEPLDRPTWALKPTIKGVLLALLSWFTRPFLEQYFLHGQKARMVAFGTLNLITEFAVLTIILSWLIAETFSIVSSSVVSIVVIAVIFIIGIFVLPAIVTLLALPITFTGSILLNLFFPIKRDGDKC